MELTTELSAEECLGRAQAYFAERWPHGGTYRRNQNIVTINVPRRQGCLRMLVSIASIGWLGPEDRVASLTAYPRDDETAIMLQSNDAELQATLDAWARDELQAHG